LIPLDLASFGGHKLGYGLPMRCSYYPKVLQKSVEQFGRSRFGFGGVDPRVLFIPSCPGLTGLTCVHDRSDRCRPLVGFASGELLDVANMASYAICSEFDFGDSWQHDHWD
jgi:hypothetical protein